jgi:hypothetical protein
MPNARDVTATSEFLKCFVVGPSGSGKSVFASSFPTPGYVFDFDQGILTYRGKDFDYDQFELSGQGWVDFEKKFLEIKKLSAEGKYQTIIFDSCTTFTDLAMERALQLDPKRSPTNGPLWNVHYQMVRNLVEGKLRQLVNFQANLVVIAHLNIIQDQESGAILGMEPLLTGQLSEKVPGYFDEVYYAKPTTVQGETVFTIQTVHKGYYKARSRLSGEQRLLPDLVRNNYNSLMEYIKDPERAKREKHAQSQSQSQSQSHQAQTKAMKR